VSGVDALAVLAAVCEGDFDKPGKPSFTEAHKALAAVAELVAASRVLRTLSATTEEFPDWPDGWDWDRIDNALAAATGEVA
jgi:hypothetical protein